MGTGEVEENRWGLQYTCSSWRTPGCAASGKWWDKQSVPRWQAKPCLRSLTWQRIVSLSVVERRTGDCHYHPAQLWSPSEGAPGPPHEWKAADAAPRGVPQQGSHGARPNSEASGSDHGDRVGWSPSGTLADDDLVLSRSSWLRRLLFPRVSGLPGPLLHSRNLSTGVWGAPVWLGEHI